MNNYSIDFTKISTTELRNIANRFKLPLNNIRTKAQLIEVVSSRYHQLSKYIKYSYIKQLGFEGLDGRTFLIRDDQSKEFAIKIYKDSKKSKDIEKEVQLQRIACAGGVAPHIIEYSACGKFVVMERLTITLYHLFREQDNVLTREQQKNIIKLFIKLDEAKVFHGDPNPLNFMRKNGKWYAIDYGFATAIDNKCIAKYGSSPNMTFMPVGLYLKFKEVFPRIQLSYIEKYIDKKYLQQK
jgi:tRNA A-37 threonylcarbamoyl transferase component Bud32